MVLCNRTDKRFHNYLSLVSSRTPLEPHNPQPWKAHAAPGKAPKYLGTGVLGTECKVDLMPETCVAEHWLYMVLEELTEVGTEMCKSGVVITSARGSEFSSVKKQLGEENAKKQADVSEADGETSGCMYTVHGSRRRIPGRGCEDRQGPKSMPTICVMTAVEACIHLHLHLRSLKLTSPRVTNCFARDVDIEDEDTRARRNATLSTTAQRLAPLLVARLHSTGQVPKSITAQGPWDQCLRPYHAA